MLTLNDSTVTSNICGGTSNSNQSLILNNSTVSENMASSCAGISGDDDSIVLTNSTVPRNIASLRAWSFLPAGSAFHALLAGDEDHADELRREQPVLDDTGGCAEPARKGARV